MESQPAWQGKIGVSLILAFIGCVFVGCIEKTLSPSAILSITKVDPYYVSWETKKVEGASDTFTLPEIKISIRSDTGVPATLKETAISYRTRIGEPIKQLPDFIRYQDIYIEPNSTTDVSVAFYDKDLLNFVSLFQSPIYPIRALFRLTIRDLNGNDIFLETSCVIPDPDTPMTAAAPSTTSNPPPTTTTTPATPTTPDLVPQLKIALPLQGTRFRLGTTISCVGSATSNITNLKWLYEAESKSGLSAAFTAGPVGSSAIVFSGSTSGGQTLFDAVEIEVY